MVSSRKRLAVFLPDLGGGGAQRATLKLARGIAERGHAVDLVLAHAAGPFMVEVPNSVQLVDLGVGRTLASLPALVSYLRRERPVVMLSALNHANLVALWARRLAGVPVRIVVSERNTFSVGAQHASSWRAKQVPRLVKRFYPWADNIVAVSKGVADDLARVARIPRYRIQAIYNPIVTPELHSKAQAPLDHPWFKPTQPPVLLAVGRLCKQKDFSTLIRAFAQVRQTHSARLLILGEGEERPALETLVRQFDLEKVTSLPGFVPNPYPYMVRASLFVLSSKWEGLPGVLIEALFCGVPSISTDCPGGSREILGDGQHGQLVPVGNVTSLANAIKTALDGQVAPPSRESWQPFERETVVNQYLDVLLES